MQFVFTIIWAFIFVFSILIISTLVRKIITYIFPNKYHSESITTFSLVIALITMALIFYASFGSGNYTQDDFEDYQPAGYYE